MAETTMQAPETTEPPAEPQTPEPATPATPAAVESELLVEDVSIDGMCGVY